MATEAEINDALNKFSRKVSEDFQVLAVRYMEQDAEFIPKVAGELIVAAVVPVVCWLASLGYSDAEVQASVQHMLEHYGNQGLTAGFVGISISEEVDS